MVKVYCEHNRLRFVGKGWEVRAKLKELAGCNLTVKEWLTRETNTHLPPQTRRGKKRDLRLIRGPWT